MDILTKLEALKFCDMIVCAKHLELRGILGKLSPEKWHVSVMDNERDCYATVNFTVADVEGINATTIHLKGWNK